MVKHLALIVLLGISFSSFSHAAADEEEILNCKLVVHTYLKNGNKKLDVDEIHAPTRKVCQAEAQIRKVVTEEAPEDIASIKVTFGWREMTN